MCHTYLHTTYSYVIQQFIYVHRHNHICILTFPSRVCIFMVETPRTVHRSCVWQRITFTRGQIYISNLYCELWPDNEKLRCHRKQLVLALVRTPIWSVAIWLARKMSSRIQQWSCTDGKGCEGEHETREPNFRQPARTWTVKDAWRGVSLSRRFSSTCYKLHAIVTSVVWPYINLYM